MTFLWSLWVKKVIQGLVQAGIAAIGANRLSTWGIQVDPVVLTAAIYGALEGLRNWLKHAKGVKWL